MSIEAASALIFAGELVLIVGWLEWPRLRRWNLRRRGERFERAYAARSGVSVDWLRAHGRIVVPCRCGDETCEGWASVSVDAVDWRLFAPPAVKPLEAEWIADQFRRAGR